MDELLTLSPDQIMEPIIPMRDDVPEEELRELAASIRVRGLINRLTVVPEGDKYRLITGRRRWMACQLAGLVEIPVVCKLLDEAEQITEMIEENLHREDPTPLDEARVFAVMQEGFGKSIMEVAATVHKSREYVAARLRILHGPPDVREALRDAQITMSVALELERCHHDGDRQFLLSHAISAGATAATVNQWVRKAAQDRAFQVAAGVPAETIVLAPPSPQLMGACEWERREMPLEATLSFRVCGECYTMLQKLRDQVFAQDAAEGGPDAPQV